MRAGRAGAAGAACEVFHNHVPLDPQSTSGLMLKKEGSKKEAELGDFLDYTLTLTNNTGIALTGVRLADQLPPGFAYEPGSTRVNSTAAADPTGGRGPKLTFDLVNEPMRPGGTLTVRYRVRIGVGAPTNGDALNRAQASSGELSARLTSNEAVWRVRVSGGVFSDEAFAFGKVFLDCNRDGVQGYEEVGVPGVRLFLEDGTSIITDVEGKWSLYGLRPATHVAKLDPLTLPRGAHLAKLDNRQGSSLDSRFIDLKKGEWHKANFAIDNCDDGEMLEQVYGRRKLLAQRPEAEGEAVQLNRRLDPEGRPMQVGDPRALPASGQLAPDGSMQPPPQRDGALIDLPGASMMPSSATVEPFTAVTQELDAAPAALPASPASPEKPLEELMPSLDNTLGFIDLEQGEVLPIPMTNVRVKGPLGTQLRLRVNGIPVDPRHVGKKATLAARHLLAWEYIAVPLVAGENTLEVESLDELSRLSELRSIKVIAPDKLARVEIELPKTARADAKTPVPVRVKLVDTQGVPVMARTPVTLEASSGRWEPADLNREEPGTQQFIEGGSAEFALIPPGEPGDARVRVSVGSVVKEAKLALLPDLRPLTGVGVIEGVINFNGRGTLALGAPRAGDAFEAELSSWSRESGDTRGAARAAFFFKGTIKGEYLLTAAFDSERDERERLFRDIRPDEFYPVYGDSAVKGFDAQSTDRLYVRIDNNRSWLMYGDFVSSASTEVRELSQTNRSLTGLTHQFENEHVRVKSYASRDSLRQQIVEFPANGTSGPFQLAGGMDLLANSERVEIVVRDRNQNNLVLRTAGLTRFADYSIEPLTRRLLLSSPVASFDAELNPQSIRITYEMDTGGPEFWVAGVDAQAKLGERVQVGVAGGIDEDPENNRKLVAATALARLGEHTVLAAEAVTTRTDLTGEGEAARVELRHQGPKLTAQVGATKTSEGFDNPGAAVSAGRTEANARLEYKVSAATALRGELIHSQDDVNEATREGAALSVQQKLSKHFTGELGARLGERTNIQSGGFNYGTVSSASGVSANPTPTSSTDDDLVTVRGRLTAQLTDSRAQVFVEAEQAIDDSERRVVALGGDYRLNEKVRAYGRYELISTLLGGPYDLERGVKNNVGIVGLESTYMRGGQLYSEYRMRDALDGRAGEAAFGLRNTFSITEGLRLTGGFEHTGAVHNFDGSNGGEATAVTSGFEYSGQGALSGRMRASGTLEYRDAEMGESSLNTLGFAYKLDRDWSLLARSVLSQTRGREGGSDQLLTRQQIGFAYRPVDQDVWNALGRYEHKLDRTRGSELDQSRAHILSAHLNVQPGLGGLYFNTRYAAKWSQVDYDDLASSYWAHLLFARMTRDLGPNWDIGVLAGVLIGEGGAQQRTAGIETGFQLAPNLWLSVGYNVLGIADRDLAGADYIDRGAYLRLRFKFDETLFTPGSGR